jgi:Effector Associated Constant Component 1
MKVVIRFDIGEQPNHPAYVSLPGDLNNWLRQEQIPGARVDVTGDPAEPGKLGLVQDLIEFSAPGAAGAILAQSLITWLKTKRPGLKMIVRLPDGTTKTIETTATKSEEEALRRFLDDAFPKPNLNETPNPDD